ncbi:MAG: hypothetical protein Q9218_002565 [Villophora microphyllina]
MSQWGKTAKIYALLPSGQFQLYFLKTVSLSTLGKYMIEGEQQSLHEIRKVSPDFAPRPLACGEYGEPGSGTYFLLTEFRHIAKQPADPAPLSHRLADLHQRSISPNGKFGFYVKTCHAMVRQEVDIWDSSWCALFTRHLDHIMATAKILFSWPFHYRQWPEFDILCRLVLIKVVPRLLDPLQSDGRVLKPCLLHGDCWDGNTAMDPGTGQAFVFDPSSFYGHNEYDLGHWSAERHLMSREDYINSYKEVFPPSAPVQDFEARHLLYTMTFNLMHALHNVYKVKTGEIDVMSDMITLCRRFCPDKLSWHLNQLRIEGVATVGEHIVESEGNTADNKADTVEGLNDSVASKETVTVDDLPATDADSEMDEWEDVGELIDGDIVDQDESRPPLVHCWLCYPRA